MEDNTAVLRSLEIRHISQPLKANSEIDIVLCPLLPDGERIVCIGIIICGRKEDLLVEESGCLSTIIPDTDEWE